MKRKLHLKQRERVIYDPPHVTGTKVVCGSCCGDDTLPRQTRLTTDGRCSGCSGRSYVFASEIAMRLRETIKRERQDQQAERGWEIVPNDADVERIPVSGGRVN